jgi:hypothetical protein
MPTALYQVIASSTLSSKLVDGIGFIAGAPLPSHSSLEPDSFVVQVDVEERRILIIEDTWVTGATALSAAIAVRRHSPTSLGLVPIARMVYESAMTDEYRAASEPRWKAGRFPRQPPASTLAVQDSVQGRVIASANASQAVQMTNSSSSACDGSAAT